MKIKLTILLAVIYTTMGLAQSTSSIAITPNGIFDKVYDRFGNVHSLYDLNINHARGSGTSTISSSGSSCTAGYFNIYFDQGSLGDINPFARTVICQVFSDVSNFLPSAPLVASGNKVNIQCSDLGSGNIYGSGTTYYAIPLSPQNPNQGIIDGLITQAVLTGVDPYSVLPISIINSSGFFHGIVKFHPGVPWSYNLASTSIGNNYDFYTAVLHEALHAMGFTTLISETGTSVFGSNHNFYSKYDKFLHDWAGNPLLTSTNSACPNTNLICANQCYSNQSRSMSKLYWEYPGYYNLQHWSSIHWFRNCHGVHSFLL